MAIPALPGSTINIQHPQVSREAPGRPSAPAERMPVPGQPRAEANRPERSPGRIPIPSPVPEVDSSEGSGKLNMLDSIKEQVESSVEYQALKPYLREIGLAEGDDTTTVSTEQETTGESDIEAEGGTQAVVRNENSEMSARFTTVEIEVNSVTYQRIEVRMEMRVEQQEVRKSDPLALDLNGNGLETTGVEKGVRFDIDGDGQQDQVSFISGGDAFLALDRNGNGIIDSGKELFGDQNGDSNGYAALSGYNDNDDGRIDAQDRVFNQLRLFTMDSDGGQQLQSLAEAGIRSISVEYSDNQQQLNRHDTIEQVSTFERNDGTVGKSADLLLGFRTLA